MDHIKIIFFDIDGTLIDLEKKYMTDRMLQTLQRLKQRGILLYAATGRSPMILPKFESFSFDGYITFNGSYCYNDSGVIYSNPIPAEDIQILPDSHSLLALDHPSNGVLYGAAVRDGRLWFYRYVYAMDIGDLVRSGSWKASNDSAIAQMSILGNFCIFTS